MNVSQANHQATSGAEDFALFRRAIVDGDADAWADGWARYRRMLISWAYRFSAANNLSECCEDIADQAFARAWLALQPERFDSFPDLAALLAYFRACVAAVVIDQVRSDATRKRAFNRLENAKSVSPDQVVLDQIECDELWLQLNRLVTTQQERVILTESLVNGLPPREILARHPHLFDDITAVYIAKRNLISRIQRSPKLRTFGH